jgi:hypothetical protein
MERIHGTETQAVSGHSFLGKLAAWAFLCVVAVAFCGSSLLFERNPLSVAVFRGGDAPQAFRVSLFLNGREPIVEETSLTLSQKHEISRAILTNDDDALRRFARNDGAEGRYAAIAAGTASSVDWPSFLGGGWSAIQQKNSSDWFSSLTLPERVVLAFWTKTPPAPPWNPLPAAIQDATPTTSQSSNIHPGNSLKPSREKATNVVTASTETALPTTIPVSTSNAAPLRVEILNGCGITNAADAVARAAKDAGMTVVFVGNAEGPGRFRVPKTFIASHAGVPVALEELCKKLGIPTADVRDNGTVKAGVDVTVTVGRDYPRLRERLRARSQR